MRFILAAAMMFTAYICREREKERENIWENFLQKFIRLRRKHKVLVIKSRKPGKLRETVAKKMCG